MKINEIKEILEQVNFPPRYITEQTAICIKALADKKKRKNLLPGHIRLSEGARIHDILNFARDELQKKVAENTRESYRKTSLKPLMNYGLIIRHQLSTNDPNTYYRLHPGVEKLLFEDNKKEKNRLITQLSSRKMAFQKRKTIRKKEIVVKINSEKLFSLSPGEHNLLQKSVAEVFSHAFLKEPEIVYIGDTAPRKGYQNRALMRKLNLPIETDSSLPDVILFSKPDHHLVIAEVVTSSGPVSSARLKQLQKFTRGPLKLGFNINYLTVFSSRSMFRKFVEDIAWDSSVWIENEPNNIVHFQKIKE